MDAKKPQYAQTSFVKDYARKAQFGELFTFDKKTSRYMCGPNSYQL